MVLGFSAWLSSSNLTKSGLFNRTASISGETDILKRSEIFARKKDILAKRKQYCFASKVGC